MPQKIGDEFLVNTATRGDQQNPAITSLRDGGLVVTWVDGSGQGGDSSSTSIKAQLFDASGAKVGNEFLVNTNWLGFQGDPTITGLTNGGFVITWTDNSWVHDDGSFSSIKAQIFNADGAKVGSEFIVNTATAYDQNGPAITSLNDGGFVITWRDLSVTRANTLEVISKRRYSTLPALKLAASSWSIPRPLANSSVPKSPA